MGWQKLYLEPKMAQQTATSVATQTASPQAPAAPNPTQSNQTQITTPSTPSRPHESKPVQVGTGTALVGDGNRIFTGWSLKSYKLGISQQAAAVDLKSVTLQEAEGEIAFDHPELAYLTNVQGNLSSTPQGVIWTYEDANIKLVRETFSNENQPFVDVRITADFKTKRPAYAFISLISQGMESDPEAQDRQLAYWSNQSLERFLMTDSQELKHVATPVKWIAAANRYFLMAFVSQGPTEPRGLVQPISANSARVSLVYPVSGNSIIVPLRAYFGPKELDILRAVEPTLDHTIDLGWFTIFAYPLLKVMKWFYQFFHNYGVSIILLTLLLKVVTYPLTYKSMKSMKEMARIQPQLQRLREKHANDKEALNREMLGLMKTHGYNPMAGCLPMLVQMPVFFALYRVLYSSIELYHAPFALWIVDLSAKDPYYVTPVLLSLTMFIQQKLSPNTATDPMQAKMIQFMPLIFGVFMITLPSGLTLYMLVNAIASIIQQLILNKKLDMGHAPAVTARAR